MKLQLTLILLMSLVYTVYSQDVALDTVLSYNRQNFRVKLAEVKPDFTILYVYRGPKTILSDTISKEGLIGIELIDFNKDGAKDIFITYGGNNFSCLLYLFDDKGNLFKSVKNFESFPAAQQLKSNSHFYYSYYRAGCADMIWVSDLFVIENFEAVQKGYIYGKGCDFELRTNPQVIEIYKVVGNKKKNKKLISTLPYSTYIPSYAVKWDFIKAYWYKNSSKFL